MATVAEAVAAYEAHVERVRTAPSRARAAVADRVAAKLRADATTKRGNVPEFAGAPGFSDNPIAATPTSEGVVVKAPAWVMRKAQEHGQPEDWSIIVEQELRRELEKA